MKIMNIGAVCAAGVVVAAAGSAEAGLEVLLVVDLSVENEITITATEGLSAATVSGSDTTGVYFEDFYAGMGGPLSASLDSGDITNVGNPSDSSPELFRADGGDDTGLNMWSWSSDFTVDFVAGTQAFEGSATWELDPAEYADMLAGNTSGNLWFPADSADDLPETLIGTYRVIPTPGVLSLCGVAGVMGIRRRR